MFVLAGSVMLFGSCMVSFLFADALNSKYPKHFLYKSKAQTFFITLAGLYLSVFLFAKITVFSAFWVGEAVQFLYRSFFFFMYLD